MGVQIERAQRYVGTRRQCPELDDDVVSTFFSKTYVLAAMQMYVRTRVSSKRRNYAKSADKTTRKNHEAHSIEKRYLHPGIVCLVLPCHIVDQLAPFELASMAFLRIRTVLDRRQPIEDVVAHHVFPSHHKACVPGVLVGFGLHDNVGAS